MCVCEQHDGVDLTLVSQCVHSVCTNRKVSSRLRLEALCLRPALPAAVAVAADADADAAPGAVASSRKLGE